MLCIGRLWFVVLYVPDVFTASDFKVLLVCPTYALLQVLHIKLTLTVYAHVIPSALALLRFEV
jgi:hypothetical protein